MRSEFERYFCNGTDRSKGGVNVSRRKEDKRWDSKFAKFIHEYGVENLAHRIAVHPSAIYQWLRGATSPHPANAIKIQKLAGERGVHLSLDEIYQHFREIRSEHYTASSLKPEPARL
jgi:DNA-binding transcriptional regulator YdaS (Cro superfamily)